MTESKFKLVRSYYRSLLEDGTMWCESRDPEEVINMTADKPNATYERLDVYETADGWYPWMEGNNGSTIRPASHSG